MARPKGIPAWNKGKKLSEAHKKALRKKHKPLSIETRLKMSIARTGQKNHKWKGGVTPINDRIRKSIEYKIWRSRVFERDNWTCQTCHTRGGVIHAHHIYSFSEYPKLRFNLDNGVTLCELCHKLTETYGLNQYSKNTNAA